jgi:hypothetical protein
MRVLIDGRNAVPVQNYITAIIVILFVEMLMTWGFYGALPVLIEADRDCSHY